MGSRHIFHSATFCHGSWETQMEENWHGLRIGNSEQSVMGGHNISSVLKVRGVTVPTDIQGMNVITISNAQNNSQPQQRVISDGLLWWGSCYRQEDWSREENQLNRTDWVGMKARNDITGSLEARVSCDTFPHGQRHKCNKPHLSLIHKRWKNSDP